MYNSFPEETLQSECLKIVRDILGERYVSIFIKDFRLLESDVDKTSHIDCIISFSNGWKSTPISGSGYGMVDALFNSMMGTFTKDFSSLSQVQFDDFAMRIKFNNTPRKSSAPAEIKISLTNERNQKIYFSAEAHSMVMASVSAICKAFEYLVNAERAVVCLRGDIEDASVRNRKDLSDRYINQMATLVRIVSYERVVKKNT